MRESAKNGTFDRCLTAAKTIASYRHGRGQGRNIATAGGHS